jgi:hypothetical protein
VNQAAVSGPTNLSDGSSLETTTTPTEIHLAIGADVRLATRSAGTFYADHVQLNQGALRVSNFGGLKVNASQLEIGSDDPGAQAVIRFKRNNIEIASVGGAVNVMDSGMLTRVAAGTKMSFQQSGAGTNPQAQPANTGAATAAPKTGKMPGDEKTFIWVIGITAVAALVVGLTAAKQGKSPF